MKTQSRTGNKSYEDAPIEDRNFLDEINESLSDFDYPLFKEDRDRTPSKWNLPTITGIAFLLVALVYALQMFGIISLGLNFGLLATALPIAAAVMIFGLVTGIFNKDKKKKKERLTIFDEDDVAQRPVRIRRDKATERVSFRLHRSRRNSKFAGICGGIAESLNVDPTLIRILFVALVLLTDGAALMFYFILSFIIPKE